MNPQLRCIRSGVALALLLGWIALAPVARADSYDALLTRAVAAKERALEQNEPSNWLDAQRLFEEADSVRPSAESRYEVGIAAERLHQEDLAVESFELSLERGLSGRARSHAQEYVAARGPELARLTLEGPPDVQVTIAGLARGKLPLPRPLVVFPGDIELSMLWPDGTIQRQRVQLVRGESHTVRLVLPAKAQNTTAPKDPVPPPQITTTAAVPADVGARGDAERPRREGPGASKALGAALVATGSVVAVAGGILVPVAIARVRSERTNLQTHCDVRRGDDVCLESPAQFLETTQASNDQIATWKGAWMAGWVGVGVGIVTAAVGTGLLLTHKSSGSNRAHWHVDVDPKRGAATLTVLGRF